MPTFNPALLAQWTAGNWLLEPPSLIRGVCHDSRRVHTDTLFVAIRGKRLDGHEYVETARANGAAAAMVDSSFAASSNCQIPLLVVDDTKQALQAMAKGYRETLKARVTGITGSVGKTTVKEMCADILSRKGITTRTQGNWNNEIGLPLSVLATDPASEYCVFELGVNHPGEMSELTSIVEPNWGVMTTIAPVHIQYFDSLDAIAAEKGEMLRALPRSGRAIFSIDDPYSSLFMKSIACPAVTVSMRCDPGEADYAGSSTGDILRVVEKTTGKTNEYVLPLPGRYIHENALLAIACGRENEISPEDVATALAGYKPLAMRWEEKILAGVRFINDAYNANPLSMESAVRTFSGMSGNGSKWLVLGGMWELGDKEEEMHRVLGAAIARIAAQCNLLTIGALGEYIARSACEAGLPQAQIHTCCSTNKAAEYLAAKLGCEDVVLLKASRGEHLENVIDEYSKRVRMHEERPETVGQT